jgi:RimJ/RimL family protein N-acetyltransferase
LSKALLAARMASAYVQSRDGRLLRVNDPDAGSAPRLVLSIGAEGAVVRLRHDVDAAMAARIAALAADEPPVCAPEQLPRFAERYRDLLAAPPLTAHSFEQIHALPHGTHWDGAAVIAQGTPEGDALWARWTRDGLPSGFVAMGFTDLTHFWPPWCAAMVGDEIGSIAFAARLGERAADIGVATVPAYRGRGLAAAVTAAWSAQSALRDRELFYSTHRDNLASQRVIAKLELAFVGVVVTI